ncbi:hypothetical protein JCM6882_006113 [Rhodosporidiobolus microsporus]
MSDRTRLPTLVPPYRSRVRDPNNGELYDWEEGQQHLDPPNAATLAALHGEMPADSGSRMRQLQGFYGSAWACGDEKALHDSLVHRLHLPEVITRFVQHILPAFYSEQPGAYASIQEAVTAYEINPRFLLVTRVERRSKSNNFSNVYVPGLPFPAVLTRSGTPALLLEGHPQGLVANPSPFGIVIHGNSELTTAVGRFQRGDWSTAGRRNELDSEARSDWHIMPRGTTKATWQYERSEKSSEAVPLPDIAVWRLDLTFPTGAVDRLRIHFDLRLLQIQHEFMSEFRVGRAGGELVVDARHRGERPVVLNSQR